MSTSVSSVKTSNDELQKLNQTSRYQQLKSKKETLEKSLNAKYELLHQICQQEALLIGNIDLIPFSNNIQYKQQQSPSHQNVNRQSSLMSNFKLPDQMHPNQHHQQNRLLQRNENDHNSYVNPPKSVDDINIHRRMKETLAIVGNNTKNLYLLNNNSNLNSERRNSMRSTSSHGSSNTFIVQASSSLASSMTSLKTLNTLQSGVLSINHNDIETFENDYRLRNDSPLSISRSSNQCLPTNKNLYLNNINVCTDSNFMLNNREYSNQFSPSHYHQFFQQPASPIRTIDNKPISRKPSYHQTSSYESQTKQTVPKVKEQFIEDTRTKQLQRAQTMSGHHSPNHYTPAHSQGLGGYWTINEHNQRIWVSDNKYPISPVHQPAIKMSKKSNSLGNFDFMYKQEKDQQNFVENPLRTNEQQQRKKNTWCETSLDDVAGETKYDNRKNRVDYENSDSNGNKRIFDNYQPVQNANKGSLKIQQENIYLNPLANNLNLSTPPVIPPKSKLRHTESTKSTTTDSENNVVPYISSLQLDSPNSSKFEVIQQGSWKPYKEEVKSYEISDFYKYSLKYRQQQEEQQNK